MDFLSPQDLANVKSEPIGAAFPMGVLWRERPRVELGRREKGEWVSFLRLL